MKATLIDLATNQVVNIIELDKNAKWEAPQNHIIVFSETASIGMYYLQGEFMTEEQYLAL